VPRLRVRDETPDARQGKLRADLSR